MMIDDLMVTARFVDSGIITGEPGSRIQNRDLHRVCGMCNCVQNDNQFYDAKIIK